MQRHVCHLPTQALFLLLLLLLPGRSLPELLTEKPFRCQLLVLLLLAVCLAACPASRLAVVAVSSRFGRVRGKAIHHNLCWLVCLLCLRSPVRLLAGHAAAAAAALQWLQQGEAAEVEAA